jgi:hypothetical protein
MLPLSNLQFSESSPSAIPRGFNSQIVVVVGITLAAIAIGLLNLVLDGNFAVTLGLVGAMVFVVASIFRPSISLYLLVFLALAIEQIVQEYGWTGKLRYHSNLNNIFPQLGGLPINPLELHLLCIVTGLLLRFVVVKEKHVPILAWKSLLMYLGMIAFFVAYGVFKGGEFLPALWEVRAIIYLVLLMAIVPQVIRTEDQVRHMIWAIIAGMGFRAIEVTRHFAGADFSLEGSVGGWGNHEDSGMLGTMIVFAIAMRIYKADKRQARVLTVLIPLMLIAIVASDRRTAYPVMAGAMIMAFMMQGPEVQRKIMRVVWKAGIVFLLYLAVFWESSSDSFFTRPAKLIREGFAGDDAAEASDSYTSNMYRKVENYDLQRMIAERPLLGTGYGVLIDYYMPVPILWDLGFYIPHNQILAVMAKTGIVGFAIFIFFYLSVMAEIGFTFNRIDESLFRAVLILAGAAVVNHLVFSFFDIVMTYYRPNVYLGSLLGLTSCVISIHQQKKDQEAAAKATVTPATQPEHHWLLLPPGEKVVIG